MQGFFEVEGVAVVSASSNVVVELMSIAIIVIRGRCDASNRENCEILLGRHRDRETAASSSRINRQHLAAIPNGMLSTNVMLRRVVAICANASVLCQT